MHRDQPLIMDSTYQPAQVAAKRGRFVRQGTVRPQLPKSTGFKSQRPRVCMYIRVYVYTYKDIHLYVFQYIYIYTYVLIHM